MSDHSPLLDYRVAIIGGLRQNSDQSRWVRDDLELGTKVAQEVGAELAKAGLRIIVYSGQEQNVECHVVKGYLRVSQKFQAIEIHLPNDESYRREHSFEGEEKYPKAFLVAPNFDADWEISFYRSLARADAVFILGGGDSTLISGALAIQNKLPLIVIPFCEGAARSIYELAQRSLSELYITPAQLAQLNIKPLESAKEASRWVQFMREQIESRERERADFHEAEQRRARDESKGRRFRWILTGLTIGLTALLVCGLLAATLHGILFFIVLVFTMMSAGAFGGLIRPFIPALAAVQMPGAEDLNLVSPSVLLGSGAGFVSALLYLLSQMGGNTSLREGLEKGLQSNQFLVLSMVFFALAGGLTLEKVFALAVNRANLEAESRKTQPKSRS